MFLPSNEILILMTALLVVTIGTISIVHDGAKIKWRRRFEQQIKYGIVNGNLTYQDMQHLAERWFQDRKAILFNLRIIHSEAISGEDKELSESVGVLRDLINEHQQIEPFAELPENISLQLSHIQKLVDSEGEDKLSQLASSLSEFYSANQNDIIKQKRFASLGLVVGILSFIVALYAILN